MVVEYDGSNFKGFQKLKDNENTIQGKLESVLSQMADENIEIIGSGRTDMGVCLLYTSLKKLKKLNKKWKRWKI